MELQDNVFEAAVVAAPAVALAVHPLPGNVIAHCTPAGLPPVATSPSERVICWPGRTVAGPVRVNVAVCPNAARATKSSVSNGFMMAGTPFARTNLRYTDTLCIGSTFVSRIKTRSGRPDRILGRGEMGNPAFSGLPGAVDYSRLAGVRSHSENHHRTNAVYTSSANNGIVNPFRAEVNPEKKRNGSREQIAPACAS